MYGVPTKQLNQQVQRNIHRFPSDFMFRLTADEYGNLKSHSVTSSLGWGGRRKWPHAFTQEGVEKAERALEGLESEQGEQAVAIHELFAAFRRLTDGKDGN
jgi:hypothetical protein